ncbi:MAG: hypothetical protein QMD95_04930 [Candidatus Hodarchaeaceae archaeon]|nr:hypothetical protein [Candidatus Hodarchaeaceae archaeon]
MVIIARREVDVRPIIGAVVVFLIIGSIIFGIYYFAIAKPAADALSLAKDSAIVQIESNLSSIGTSQATSSALDYKSQVRGAGSIADINSILNNVNTTVQTEQKRKELLDLAKTATDGTYYSATAASNKTQVQALADLSQALKTAINAKQTKSDLEAYAPQIDNQATTTWQTLLTDVVNQIAENRVALTRNSPAYGEFMGKENAITYIRGQNWQVLRELKFEGATVRVPVLDTFQRTPTIKAGSTVKVYVYDTVTDNMRLMYGNAIVSNVIYSQADIGTIAWTLTDGATSQSYSVNMWETLKAAAAGDAEAAAVGWSAYGADLMDRALTANIGKYTVSVIYVVEVSDTIGEQIAQYEFHESATKDIILIPTV